MKLLGYIRRSQDSGTGVSEELQREKIAQWAALYDHEIKFLKPDLDESSWTLDRPGLTDALKMLGAGKAEGIVAATQDRITRRTRDFCNLLELAEEQGWHMFAVDTGLDTTKDSTLHKVLAVFAEREYLDKRERFRDARRNALMEHGVHLGNTPGYTHTIRGYDKSGKALRGPLAPNADAPKIRAAFELVAGDEPWTWRQVIEILGATSQGKARNILRNRTYLGEASGEGVKPGAHPAIVSEELFARVQRKLDRKRADNPASGTRGGPPALLAKLLHCSGCGHALTPDKSIAGYRCKRKSIGLCTQGVSIRSAKVEPFILAEALRCHEQDTALRLASPADGALAEAESALAAAREERDAVEAMNAAGELSPVAYAGARTAADKAVEAAEVALANVEHTSGWLTIPHARVLERIEDPEQARDFLREMFVGATVSPGDGSVQERVELMRRTAVPVPGKTETFEEWAESEGLPLEDPAGMAEEAAATG
jgi:DNA invertase Pin-like site-specific DNA recombinase